MKKTLLLAVLCLLCYAQTSHSQSVPRPPGTPPYDVISPWGYDQVGTNWNTSNYLPFIFQNVWFRLMPPNGVTYNSATNSWNFSEPGKKYPVILFNHGAGERGTDNNNQLKHGGQLHKDAVLSGKFPGWLVYWQTESGTVSANWINNVINRMIQTMNADADRIYTHGLSRGGAMTWHILTENPKLIAAAFPMSSAAAIFSQSIAHVPVRFAQGGLDTNPLPVQAEEIVDDYEAGGGNMEYLYYEDLGHGTWNRCYAMPDFFSWFLSQRKNKIHVFFGETEVCPGDPVNIKMGFTPGFDGYEWRRNGVTLGGATQNNYTATTFGNYQGRFRRGSTWTEWSEVVEIKEKEPTQSPLIATTGLQSAVLPSVTGSNSVQLEMPAGYQTYVWKNAANGNVIGTQRTITISTPGSYVANVAEFGGCSSLDSPPFLVVAANGPNAPDAIANLQIAPEGLTSLKLNWENNPTPANDETGFEIYRSTSETGPWQLIKINPANVLTHTDINLLSGNRYYYVIRAINNTGASSVSTPVSGVTGLDEIAPTPPASLTVTASTPTSVTLRWNASTDNVGVVAYDIFANGIKVYTSTTIASQVTFVVNGLLSNQLYNFVVRARDATGNLSEPSQQVSRPTTMTGLNYSYYQGDWNALPDFNQLVPTQVGWVSNFSLSPRLQNDFFAFRFVGKLNVPTSGTHTFYLNSDDGSRLYIDGVLRVDHDGLHGTGEKAGSPFSLSAGVHDIVVEFFEKSGGEALTVRWRRPGQSTQTIPASALTDVFTPPATPATPTGLAVTAQSYEALLISWTAYAGTGTSIEIQTSTNNSTWFPLATVPATQNNYTATGLTANRRYYYRIRAIGSTGESSFTASRNTFTLQLPPVPAVPSSLTGTGTATSASLQWNDNSTNETGFEIFKSVGDNQNYALAATIAENALPQATYVDEGLFAHTTYFYKVRSKNVSGTSAFSNEFTVTTTNSAPVISPVTSFAMRFDEEKVVALAASDSDGDVVVLSSNTLPPFAELYDYGDGTGEIFFTPTAADLGDYQNIQVTASDAYGGSTVISFNVGVNNNHSPTINPIPNASVNETEVLNTSITATDLDGDAVTWELSDVPNFVTYESVGNNLNLLISPEGTDAGIYTISLKAKDAQGGFSTAEFVVEVIELQSDFFVYVNFGAAGSVPSPWNNFTSANQGASLANLRDESGSETGFGITLQTAWSGSSATGGTTPGLYPNAVMNSYLSTASNSDPEFIRVTGLNPNHRYNFDFFASRNSNEDRTTVFTINGVSSSVDATGNTSNIAEINGIAPSASGEVLIEVTAAVQYGYLNAMVIESYFEGYTPPAVPANFMVGYTGGETETRDIQLNWTDNSDNESGFEIFRSTDGTNFTSYYTTAEDAEEFVDLEYEPFYTYYYTIRAFNNNGHSAFTDTLSIEALNQAPRIDPVPNISVSENEEKTVLVTASDPEGGAVMFFLQGAPEFVYLQYVNPNTMRMVASPLDGTNGVYNFSVGVMDDYGDISTAPATITVTDFPETLIYLNFTQNGINASAPWNNRAFASNFASAGTSLQNMLDHHNVATTIDATIDQAWGGANTSGAQVGLYEPNVMRTALFANNASRTITLSGLKADHTYDLTIFASRQEASATNRNVTYSSGTKSATINASNNTSDVAQLFGLEPNGAGQLTLTVARGQGNTQYVYISSLIIREYKSDGLPVAPVNVQTSALGSNRIGITWSDQSDETGFEIWRSQGNNANYQLLTTTAANAQSYEDTGLAIATTYYYKVRAKVDATTFSAFSAESSATTYQYSVSINFGAVNLAAGWNNLTAFLGAPNDVVENLLNNSGISSGMRLRIIDPFADDNLSGMNTGNNSGVVPDAVMESAYWVDPGGITATFRIENMNVSHAYTFSFFGSRDGGGNRNTIYTIGNQSVTLNASYNTMNLAQIKDVVADENGGVTISVKAAPNSAFGYLNGLIIQGAPASQGGGAIARKATSSDDLSESLNSVETTLEESVSTYPNPFEDQIVIRSHYSAAIADVALVTTTGYASQVSFTTNGSDGDHHINLSNLNLNGGLYLLKIRFTDGANKTVKLIKK